MRVMGYQGHRFKLSDYHPAIVQGHSIFRNSIVDPNERPRLLINGQNPKLGPKVIKGRLKDFPIYTLTLEERKTCPMTCLEWKTCYGNNMHFAKRIRHGDAMESRLWDELAILQQINPKGFLVRLHVLGDFYSVDYVQLWHEALEAYPALHIFGYTARKPQSDIGREICELIGVWPERFHVRFSGWNGPRNGAVVVNHASETQHIVCPEQTGKAKTCGNCGLCWHSDRTIAFLRH